MILVYPPAAKVCEPPAGIARLSGVLELHGVKHTLVDANLEGLLFLLNHAKEQIKNESDRWTVRALRHLDGNIAGLRDRSLYRSIDRYKRAAIDLNRVLERTGAHYGADLSLSNYERRELSAARSADLLQAAEQPELDPFYDYFAPRLSGLVEQEGPSTVGFSLTYLGQAFSTFAMLGFLREKYPGLKLVCGGGLVTSWLRRPGWRNPFGGLIDLLVEGPGEEAILRLAGANEPSAGDCKPRYEALPLSDYLSPGVVLPYSGSGGCYWNRCSFCPEQAEANAYLPVGVSTAMSELQDLVQAVKPSLIHLLDNAISPALMKGLIASPPGVPWYGFARIGRELADPGYCMELKRAGCVMLKLGIESGDQSVLDRLRKGIDLEVASKALKSLRQAGIATYVYLLFGTPAETLEAARRTLDFTVRNSDGVGFLNLAVFNMPVGSAEAMEFRTREFYEGDLSLYTDFEHPAGWNRREVRKYLDAEFKRHPVVSAILRNDPPFFTSNHAPFFVMNRAAGG